MAPDSGRDYIVFALVEQCRRICGMQQPRAILITGASSGIGEALACAYAAPGIFLALTGRDVERLARVAEACRKAGARVATCAADITHGAGFVTWIDTIDRQEKLDLAIANAGVSAGTGGNGETPEQARRIVAVNVDGVLHTVLPLIPRMVARRRGQIALMSSLASFRGLPGAPAYCASKAMVRVWGEALRPELAVHGVGVSVICPGFVESRMTEVNRFWMPLLMPAERAAAIIKRGLARNRARIAFPWRLYAVTRLIAALPPALIDPLLARLPRKGGQ
jgi:short-subunit dehydrogenase